MASKLKKSEQERDSVSLRDMDTEEHIALKKATKKSKKRKSVDEEGEAEVNSEKKHKKSKKDVEPDVAELKKKSKKSKKDSERANSDDEKAARKEKKRLKKERKERKERKAAVTLKDAEDAKVKEAEAEKAKDMATKKDRQSELAPQPVTSADQWNPDALTGDAARKNKFLRLLGAGKGAGIEAAPKKQQASDKDIRRVENELERQFAAGIRMKHGGMGKRTGLGM